MKLTATLLLASCLAVSAETEDKINKHFAVEPGGTLIVDVDFGSIDVSAKATSEVVAEVVRKISRGNKDDEEAFLAGHPVTFSQDGNTISIRSRAQSKRSQSSHGRERTEGKYSITVPAQFNVQLKTSGGRIALNHLDGNAKAETSGGAIEVSHGAGSLQGHTSGGPVAVKKFNGPVQVKTDGGGIEIENVTGKVEGSTSGGSISARFSSPLRDEVKLKTSGGGVTVRVPENSAFDLDASTSGGTVRSDLAVSTIGKRAPNKLRGAVNGGGKPVVLYTSGGSIHLKSL